MSVLAFESFDGLRYFHEENLFIKKHRRLVKAAVDLREARIKEKEEREKREKEEQQQNIDAMSVQVDSEEK